MLDEINDMIFGEEEWGRQGTTAIAVALTVFEAVLAGVAFRIIMAWYLRSKAAQLRLPSSWEDYPEA